jgi:hypothetical protein
MGETAGDFILGVFFTDSVRSYGDCGGERKRTAITTTKQVVVGGGGRDSSPLGKKSTG